MNAFIFYYSTLDIIKQVVAACYIQLSVIARDLLSFIECSSLTTQLIINHQ